MSCRFEYIYLLQCCQGGQCEGECPLCYLVSALLASDDNFTEAHLEGNLFEALKLIATLSTKSPYLLGRGLVTWVLVTVYIVVPCSHSVG